MSEKRYEHKYNQIKFYLSDYIPNPEECRMLMLKMLEQGIRDYISLYDAQLPSDKLSWEEAKRFIFDDDYIFDWGNLVMNLEDMLDILDLNIHWVRKRIVIRFKKARGCSHGTKEN